jgi:AraC-like DNA-binding protein
VTTDATWVGRLFFGPWWMVYAGAVGATEQHRHHAIQVVAAPGTRVVDTAGDHPSPAVVAPDHLHAIAGEGTGVVAFIDPEATAAPGLASGRPLPAGVVEPTLPVTMGDAARLVGSLTEADGSLSADRHPAVDRLLALLADDPDAPLAVLAGAVGLSASRVTHLFRDQVGISLRSYRRWVRLLLAADAVRGGASLTDAAHGAGFADVAHLHRTFRDQFGLRPGPLLRAVEWVT